MVTNGGIHGLFLICQALLEPGDEVIVPDPEWPPCMGNISAARGVPVPCRLHEDLGWRYDLDELAVEDHAADAGDLHQLAAQPDRRRADAGGRRSDRRDRAASADLWLISDEAYEDVLFDGAEHVSPASLPGMYERTISVFTFSKSYAMTGLRLGYVVCSDAAAARADEEGAVLHRQQRRLDRAVRRHRRARRTAGFDRDVPRASCRRGAISSTTGIRAARRQVFSGAPPRARSTRSCRIDPAMAAGGGVPDTGSLSWAMAEHLIARGRIGCVPGVDFGANGEGYIRFCFARERAELTGALDSMRTVFATGVNQRSASALHLAAFEQLDRAPRDSKCARG